MRLHPKTKADVYKRQHVTRTRDKTFFFFSYEGLYLSQPTPQAFQYTPAFDLRHEVPAALVPVLDTFPDYGGSEIINAAGQPTGLALNLLPPFKLPAAVNSTSLRLDCLLYTSRCV